MNNGNYEFDRAKTLQWRNIEYIIDKITCQVAGF